VSDPEDPSRLFDDASASEGLRRSLRAAQADVGSDAEVARLARRLGPLLGAGLVAGAATGGGAGAGAHGSAVALSATAKLGLAALALAAVGGGAWWITSARAPSPARPVAAVVTAAPEATPSPLPEPEPTSAPSPAAEPEPSVSTPPTPEKPAAPAQLSEVELLEQARQALKSDPRRALQRANEHARRFPRGVLVQEREVLAIQALRRLGRDADADRRAEAFAKAFPGSAFQRNLKPSP
jgi:hypothetical protein